MAEKASIAPVEATRYKSIGLLTPLEFARGFTIERRFFYDPLMALWFSHRETVEKKFKYGWIP